MDAELDLISPLLPLSILTINSKEEGLSSRRSRVQIPAGAYLI
jgi:hypothetical protein